MDKMTWIKYPQYKPQKDGKYIIALKEPEGSKDFFYFTFIAKYDSANDKWYHFDPILKTENSKPIPIEIIGWMNLPDTLIG